MYLVGLTSEEASERKWLSVGDGSAGASGCGVLCRGCHSKAGQEKEYRQSLSKYFARKHGRSSEKRFKKMPTTNRAAWDAAALTIWIVLRTGQASLGKRNAFRSGMDLGPPMLRGRYTLSSAS